MSRRRPTTTWAAARRSILPLAVAATAAAALGVGLLTAHRLAAADAPAAAQAAAASYANDFERAAPGSKPPADMLVLNGAFAVREAGGNHFLELTPDPLDIDGILFGPPGQTTIDVGACIAGTADGKLFPEFGIGCGDSGGYKLFLMPGQQAIELRKGEEPKARADYTAWAGSAWTNLRLRMTAPGPGKWRIEGKAWPTDAKEPEAWAIAFEDAEAPPAGRASIWAVPYSGTPVRFDDLRCGPAEGGK